jgi:gliding-associated putative ABC transporter substrate-binding component GldG
MKKNRKLIWWVGLLAGLIGINVLASLVHGRFDLTEEKRYSLSAPTSQVFAGLQQPVTIDVFVTGDELPAVVRKFQDAVGDFLSEAREYSGNRIQYRFINPYENLADTSAERLMEDSLQYEYGLYPALLDAPEKVGDKMEIVKLIHGAVIRYGDASMGIDFLQGVKNLGTGEAERAALYNEVESKLEYKFASAIQKITTTDKPVIAYALGNGEGWGYNVDDAVRTLLNDYAFDTLNIPQAPYIPSQIDALVILKPTQAFSDRDKLKIDQYVMNGGKVLWMLDNMYTEFDSLYQSQGFIAFDRGLNLEDILFNYGVRINQNLLQDMQCDKLPQMSSETQQQRLVDWPFFPILNGTEHPISKNLDGVRSMFPTTMDTVEATGIRKTFLLHSSNNSRVLSAPAKIDFEFLQIAPDERLFTARNVPVAVLLEGKFRSLYRGRAPKAFADSLAAYGQPFRNETSAEGKMIVISDGDIAMNQVSQFDGPLPMGTNFFTRYTYANRDFFLNSLDYLVNPSNVLSTRAKEFTLRLLDPRKTEAERSKWQMLNIGVPVLLIILFGFVYQQLRKYWYAG